MVPVFSLFSLFLILSVFSVFFLVHSHLLTFGSWSTRGEARQHQHAGEKKLILNTVKRVKGPSASTNEGRAHNIDTKVKMSMSVCLFFFIYSWKTTESLKNSTIPPLSENSRDLVGFLF